MRSILALANVGLGAVGILIFFRTSEPPALLMGAILFMAGIGTFGILVLSTALDISQVALYYLAGGTALVASAVLSLFGAYSLTFASESGTQLVSFWSMAIGAANVFVLVRIFGLVSAARTREAEGQKIVE